MNHLLKQYCPRIEFDSYEDFYQNFKINVPANFNFAYDVVDEWAHVEPEKIALVWCDDADDEKVLTFAQLSELSKRFANALRAQGIGKGDIVLLMLRQRWEYWVSAVALHRLGAILIPAAVQLSTKDIIYRVNSAEVKALIALENDYVFTQIEAALPECPTLGTLISVNALESTRPIAANEEIAWQSWDSLVEQASAEWQRPQGELATTSSDIMLIYFTSGTTGYAKMCCHNFAHPLGHIITAKYWQQVQENKLHCSVTDSGWAKFGWGKIYGQWIAGAAVFAYDTGKFDPKRLLERIARYQVTTFCVPPTMYRFMLQEDMSAFDLSSVETFATAGEPLNAEVTLKWEEATGKRIREGFGQSEGPVLLATFPWLDPKPGSMGKPSPLMNIKLLDTAGREVPDGDEGNICVTGLKEAYPPGLFVGYYHDEMRTEESVGGAYYNLNDVAWRDSDGYFTFVGRSDDVIKCSGYRISPFEVESVLLEHPAVIESAVTAYPDEMRGSVVKATVVLTNDYSASDDLVKELQNYVKHNTAPYKYPRIVEFVDELPKTIGGKIKRAQIAAKDAGRTWYEEDK
ncbi:MAG: AMP-binding protein [Coriobacteriales bacterium]|jgi:acetyl-CoA synthetase|nr:AMP-binding protein [Coriobacteriales bacterium]